MIDWWGPILSEYYAGTEGNGFTFCDSEQWLAHPGTVGAPLNCEVHIVDEATGTEVPAGEEGVVYFSGGNSSSITSTKRRPASPAAQRLVHPGRHRPGRQRGFLYLTDRKAHMIISGGVNVYPQEAREPADHAPRGARRGCDRCARRRPGRGGQGSGPAHGDAPPATRPRPNWSTSWSTIAGPASPRSSAPAPWTSARTCPATRRASSTSASCATSTGKTKTAASSGPSRN